MNHNEYLCTTTGRWRERQQRKLISWLSREYMDRGRHHEGDERCLMLLSFTTLFSVTRHALSSCAKIAIDFCRKDRDWFQRLPLKQRRLQFQWFRSAGLHLTKTKIIIGLVEVLIIMMSLSSQNIWRGSSAHIIQGVLGGICQTLGQGSSTFSKLCTPLKKN